jgi:hypothetical protein
MGDRPMLNKNVTLCITSYDRFDLLKQTIDSFISLNTYPIERIAIIEDSTKQDIKNKILQEYGDKVDLIFNENRIGQAPAIDKLYNTVTTKYIFHTEDDYLYSGNSNFIKESIDLLEEREDVHQVWVKHFSDFAGESCNQFENNILQTVGGTKYKMLKSPFYGWCGFSWFPGLRRLEDYHKIFPTGYTPFITAEYLTSGVQTEAACNTHALKQGYRAAYLLNGACSHKGTNGRETYK